MSAERKSFLPAALMLALIMGSAAPAAGQGGLWTYLYLLGDNVTLSVVNLTTQRLVITSPAAGDSWGTHCYSLGNATDCLKTQSHPFQMASNSPSDCPGTLCIDPYRTATWGSFGTDRILNGDFAWDGRFSVAYENAASPWALWTVWVNAAAESPGARKNGKGTWFYLNTVHTTGPGSCGPLWAYPDGVLVGPYLYGAYADGIYVTPILYPGVLYATWAFSAMTISGNDCGGQLSGRPIIALFAGTDNHPVLVVREDLGGDNYIGWALYFVDQPDSSFPD